MGAGGAREIRMRTHAWGYTGWKVPVVGQGTWQLEADDRAQAIAALRRGLDLGLTHVDTAELYGDGEVEDARARGDRRPARRGVPRLEGPPEERQLPEHDRRVRAIAEAARDGPARRVPAPLARRGAARGDDRARSRSSSTDGKIRSWGVSNFDVDELEEAERIAGPGRIACNQVLYHLQERTIEARGAAVVRGAGDRGRRLQPVRLGAASLRRRARAARRSRRSPRRTARPRGRSRSRSSPGSRRSSRSRSRRARRTPRTTPERGRSG